MDTLPPVKGLFELHVFLTPLNPTEAEVKVYNDVVEEINRDLNIKSALTMRPCYLALCYTEGDVKVLQTSRYYEARSLKEAFIEMRKEADRLQEKFDTVWKAGKLKRRINVTREKIELMYSAKGIPQDEKEMASWPGRYHEFHIRVRHVEDTLVMTPELETKLRAISAKYTALCHRPIPLSYNMHKQQQRYLNVRFECGAIKAKKQAMALVALINADPVLKVEKVLQEFVIYDTYRLLDKGWID